MWAVRVPVKTVEAFQRAFAQHRMAAFDRPGRHPTPRENAVERLLWFLEAAPPETAAGWEAITVHYIGREYTAREVADIRALAQETLPRGITALAEKFCRLPGLAHADGRARTATANDVLRRMAMDNLISLPQPKPCRKRIRDCTASELPEALIPQTVSADQIRHLSIVPVMDAASSRLWREALRRHHYIGGQTLFGAQMRYLVYGAREDEPASPQARPLLAALGFASSAWRVTARDHFIGWSDPDRVRNLKFVVGNARFLILPWIRAPHLASRILGRVARRLPADWEARYGFRPVLLETFVQLDRFTGTCYRAANWICVGTTEGCSVYGHEARNQAPERAVFVYPLRRDFRRVLCTAGPERIGGTGRRQSDAPFRGATTRLI